MVRRILHNAGHSVLLLHRTRYGFIELGHSERTSCATKKRIQDLWPPQTDLVPGLIRPCYESEQMWAAKLFKS